MFNHFPKFGTLLSLGTLYNVDRLTHTTAAVLSRLLAQSAVYCVGQLVARSPSQLFNTSVSWSSACLVSCLLRQSAGHTFACPRSPRPAVRTRSRRYLHHLLSADVRESRDNTATHSIMYVLYLFTVSNNPTSGLFSE